MKLSKPDDDPNEPVEESGSGGASFPAERFESVASTVEENANQIGELQAASEEAGRLAGRVRELEKTVEQMRADLAGLFLEASKETVDGRLALEIDGETWVPGSVDARDPLGEFEE